MADFARIEFESVNALVRTLDDRAARAVRELRAPIADAMHAEVLEVFETEGYGEWPQYADSTLNRKLFGPRRSSNPKLLQDTGNLVGSLQPAWDDSSVEVFTNVPYAKYHISARPRRVIPLRDFFAIDVAAFEADVVDMFETYMLRHTPTAAE